MRSDNLRRLGDAELLARLVGKRESRKLYRGSLRAVFEEESHERCAAARELVRRWLEEKLTERCVLGQPQAVREYLKLHFAGQEHESFVMLHLNAQNALIAAEELFRGTLTQTSVYPREVVKSALAKNSASVIVAHNHPSGIPEPSFQDQALTKSLSESLALVDVRLIDHFLVAGRKATSFAEKGLL